MFAIIDIPTPDRRRYHALAPQVCHLRLQWVSFMLSGRSHVYTTFHGNEIHLDSIVLESDWTDPQMMLTSDKCDLDKWQVDTALATWKAMKNSMSPVLGGPHSFVPNSSYCLVLTPEMWLAW